MFKIFIFLNIFYLGQLEKVSNGSYQVSLNENKLQMNIKDNKESNSTKSHMIERAKFSKSCNDSSTDTDVENLFQANYVSQKNSSSDVLTTSIIDKNIERKFISDDKYYNDSTEVHSIVPKSTKKYNGHLEGITRRIIPVMINSNDEGHQDFKIPLNKPQSYNDLEIVRILEDDISNIANTDVGNEININTKANKKPMQHEEIIRSRRMEPTKGEGIYDMREVQVLLVKNSRVCYACSSYYDVTCWNPDRRTTVKYCRKGHESCLTKIYKGKGAPIIIRDCGSVCVDPNTINIEEKYISCSICHDDLCNTNSATHMRAYSMGITVIIVLTILFNKHLFLDTSHFV